MQWFLSHRLLMIIYVAGIALAVSELHLSSDRLGELESPSAYLEPGINVADVSSEIYPDRALTLYYRAYQASLCSVPKEKQPEGCRLREPVAPGQIRELIERSLATGNRSIEMAMYNYALVLIQEGAPQEEIDAAVYDWRTSHPGSSQPDPRHLNRGAK